MRLSMAEARGAHRPMYGAATPGWHSVLVDLPTPNDCRLWIGFCCELGFQFWVKWLAERKKRIRNSP